jgi:hypothetical protein
MPTDTDVKLATDLADFRVEMVERFGKLDAAVAERFGRQEAAVAERFGKVHAEFAAIRTELGIIRKLGTWLLGGVFGAVGAMIIGSATIAWSASAVNSKVEQQGARLDKVEGRIDQVEKRLDRIDQKLDTLISRTAPKAEK